MSRDIKVGDYIRTSHGHIGKIKRIENDKSDKGLKWYVYEEKEYDINILKEVYINKPYIVDASSDIRDLVREGDYIINHRIVDIDKGYYTTKGDNNNIKDVTKHKKDDIIGIVKFRIPYVGYPSVMISELFS